MKSSYSVYFLVSLLLHRRFTNAINTQLVPEPPALDAACAVRVENGAKRTLHLAFGFYGLPRHICTSANIKSVIFDPLHETKDFNFIYDVFAHINYVPYPFDPRSSDSGRNAIDPYAYRRYKACYYTVEDQKLVDKELVPILNGTLKRWGDYWKTPSGSTTVNLIRALKSQHRIADLITAQEGVQGFKYDIIINARVDVLFTREIGVQRYHEIMQAFDARQQSLVLVPDYAQWGGYNDRFSMGHRDTMIKILRRVDSAVSYCEQTRQAINSEKYIRDFILFLGLPSAEVNVGYNRRVRSDGSIHPAQYGKRGKHNCTLDNLSKCHHDEIQKNVLCHYHNGLTSATFDKSELKGVNKVLWKKFHLD